MAKTTALQPLTYATGGAVEQDGKLKIMVCNTCGSEVVWATNNKTNRMYLCDISKGGGARYYRKDRRHDCDAKLAQQAAARDSFQRLRDSERINSAESLWYFVTDKAEDMGMRAGLGHVLTFCAYMLSDEYEAKSFAQESWDRYYGVSEVAA